MDIAAQIGIRAEIGCPPGGVLHRAVAVGQHEAGGLLAQQLGLELCLVCGVEDQLGLSLAGLFARKARFLALLQEERYVFSRETGLGINFSACDCPMDSIIIEKLGGSGIWSKLTEQAYDALQQKADESIRRHPAYSELGRLAYDFVNW